MVRSFDPTDLSLSGAADMVAVRARLGVAARSPMTKEAGIVEDLLAKLKNMGNPLANFDISNPAHAAMLGGGIGVGGGLLATIMSKRKKKRWLRNMLMGGALGAGIGGAGSYMAKEMPDLFETEATDQVKRYKANEVTLEKMRSGDTPAAPDQLDALKSEQIKLYRAIQGSGAGPDIESPLPPTSPDAVSRMGTLSLNLSEGDVGSAAKNMLGWGWHDAANNPANTVATTLAGGLAGTGVDWLRNRRYVQSPAGQRAEAGRTPVTSAEIARFEARMKAPFTAQEARNQAAQANIPPEIVKQIAATTDAPVKPQLQPQLKPKPQPGKPKVVTEVGTPSLPSFGRPVGNKPPLVPAILGPSGSSMALPIRRPPALPTGIGDIFTDVDIQKQKPQFQSNVEGMRRGLAAKEQSVVKPQVGRIPRLGSFVRRHAAKGSLGALGAAASLFSDWGRNKAEAARSFSP